jgi:hypothetical protein
VYKCFTDCDCLYDPAAAHERVISKVRYPKLWY